MLRRRIILGAAVLLAAAPLAGQMPDWKFFRDRDGNTYFIDRAGVIRIIDDKPRRVPVTAAAIDYHYNRAVEYIKDHRVVEGLSVIKSILALPDGGNNRIVQARRKASKVLGELKKRHGTRFPAFDEKACVSIFVDGTVTVVENDLMRYRLAAPGDVYVVREKQRIANGYRYGGLTLGVRDRKGSGDAGAVDLLIAVDAEYFAAGVRSYDEAMARLRDNAGRDTMLREELSPQGGFRWWRITERDEGNIAGYEGIAWNGPYLCMVRIVTSRQRIGVLAETMEGIRASFRTVSP